MDKRLVKIVGRSEEMGRPSLFGTTEEFLEVFNLANVEQLPPENELAELAMKPEVAAIADIKSVVFGGDRTKFEFDEFEELDQLSESIKEIAAETDFTMLLKQEEKRRIDGDSGVKRSAFDILEEFVLREESIKQNRAAVASEPLMTALEPKSADVAFEGVLNAPEVDVEWEEHNRELVIDEEETASHLNLTLSEDEEEFTLEDEAFELEMALNKAFENLTGEKLSDEELSENLDGSIQDLDFTVDSAVKEAMSMDLDLSFLKEALPSDDNRDQLE
jgi:segregation and condensation protein B